MKRHSSARLVVAIPLPQSAARRAAFEASHSAVATEYLKLELLRPAAPRVACAATRKLHSPVPASSDSGSPCFRRRARGHHSSAKTRASNSHFETFRIQPTGGSVRDFRRKDQEAECRSASQRPRSRRFGPSQKSFSESHSEKEKRGTRNRAGARWASKPGSHSR